MNTTMQSQKINNLNLKVDTLESYDIFSYKTMELARDSRLRELINELNFSNLQDKQKTTIEQLCIEYADVFSLANDPLTVNNFYRQKIKLNDEIPVFTKPYRLPQAHQQAIKGQIQKMLEENIIENSTSAYNSPILLVPN